MLISKQLSSRFNQIYSLKLGEILCRLNISLCKAVSSDSRFFFVPRGGFWLHTEFTEDTEFLKLFVFRFSLFTFHFSLPTFHFSLPTFHFSLPTSPFSLPTFHFSLPTFHFSLPTFHFSFVLSQTRSCAMCCR